MRKRFAAVVLPLLVLLVLAVLVPAGATTAQRHSTAMLSDRILDAERFASLTRAALESSPVRLRAELDDYAQLYDSAVHVVGRDGRVIHSTAPEAATGAREAAGPALAGRPPAAELRILPWGESAATVAAPVGHDSQVLAAVVITAPTAALRAATLRDWALLALAALVPLVVIIAALGPVSAWVLRPLERFDTLLRSMRRGRLSLRADAETGPPELRGVARSFNELADAVTVAYERQQRFTADASHQLRNPLASLRIAVDNLEPHTVDPDSREVHAEAVETIERMDALVTAMLTAAHPADPGAQGSAVLADVPTERWEDLARSSGADLAVDLPAVRVVRPVGGLESLVGELVDNALRLGSARSVSVTAELPADDAQQGGRDAASLCHVHVDDDGCGMTPEERERALDRLWRAPRVQNLPGTGLGLHIVATAVEESGGTLELGDSPAGGLRVSLLLPLRRP